ncbi:cytochrome P450 [Amycolatopsis dongchuanensis]|uniref:Cytochrome P450 n=1 Tax=Amycolatopsis dongchuanensis TaxID=1070866 RepID=A0ABP9R1L0_9PSEU
MARVVLPNGRELWALTRLQDIRTMLTDPRFSSDRSHPGFPVLTGQQQTTTNLRVSMIGMDPPEHGPVRRSVLRDFTVKRVAALRPRIQEVVDEHLDAMLAGPKPADLVQALSLPVSSLIICELLGVPYADHEFFQEQSAKLLRRTAPREELAAALGALQKYLLELVQRKEREPGDDLLTRQLPRYDDQRELVGLAFLLLVAGHETTANMISLGTIMLLEHPEALAAIREDPAKVPNAVEELLRYFTIAEYASRRVAVEDVELGGVRIRAGDGVLPLGAIANRDPEAFDNPDEFDIERGARHHIAFGFGAHQCLGQNLARMELQVVFETLFQRAPSLRLAVPSGELQYKDDGIVYGVYELPVTW